MKKILVGAAIAAVCVQSAMAYTHVNLTEQLTNNTTQDIDVENVHHYQANTNDNTSLFQTISKGSVGMINFWMENRGSASYTNNDGITFHVTENGNSVDCGYFDIHAGNEQNLPNPSGIGGTPFSIGIRAGAINDSLKCGLSIQDNQSPVNYDPFGAGTRHGYFTIIESPQQF